MTGHGNGQANAAAGGGMTAERAMQRGGGTQATKDAQAMPQRSRWGRIWPWALLWGAAPMPLYIWLVVGMVV